MATYKYTGADERIPAPPLQGELRPGETVHSEEPVDHPDLKEVATIAASNAATAETLPVQATPRRRGARTSQE